MRNPNSSRQVAQAMSVTRPMRQRFPATTINATVMGIHGPQQHVSELRPAAE